MYKFKPQVFNIPLTETEAFDSPFDKLQFQRKGKTFSIEGIYRVPAGYSPIMNVYSNISLNQLKLLKSYLNTIDLDRFD